MLTQKELILMTFKKQMKKVFYFFFGFLRKFLIVVKYT